MNDMHFQQRVRTALLWRSGTQFAAQALSWASTLLVIRLLVPADYGLMAMVQAITALLTILSGNSFAAALVRDEQDMVQRRAQIFGLLLLINLALALVQWGIAPWVARYYQHAQVAELLRVQALGFLCIPLIAMPNALASRHLDFASQGKANLIANIASAATTLATAYAGWGVWALVAGQLSLLFVRAGLMALWVRWWVKPSFDFSGMGTTLRFGSHMMATSLIWFLYSQSDIFIGGRMLDAHALGLYSTALFLAQIPVSKLLPAINEVGYSAYARLQAEPELLRQKLLAAVALAALILLPIHAGLAALAWPFTQAILGTQWLAAAPFVAWLSLVMPLYTIQTLLSPAINAQGNAHILTGNAALGVLLMPAAFALGIVWDGAAGLIWAWLLAFPLYSALSLRRSLGALEVKAHRLGHSVWPALISSAVMGLAIYGLQYLLRLSPWQMLLLCTLFGMAFYAALLRIFFPKSWAQVVRQFSKNEAPR